MRFPFHAVSVAAALSLVVAGCKPAAKPDITTQPENNSVSPELAAARLETAALKLDDGLADEALRLVAASLEADPGSGDAAALARRIVGETVWSVPEIVISHGLAVDHVAFLPPNDIFTSVSDGVAAEGFNSTVCWDLASLTAKSVLFPARGCPTRSLTLDPTGRSVVIERGGNTLLCDAKSLKPICDLGALPEEFTPSAVIAFSPDGLLLAHPAADKDGAIIWHIKDTATGDIVRSSQPLAADASYPVAGHLDRKRLRVLNEDGCVLEVPISPLEAESLVPPKEPIHLLSGHWNDDGQSALVLENPGPHEKPRRRNLQFGPAGSAVDPLEFPWSRQPSVWSGLLRDEPPMAVEGQILKIPGHAPIRTASKITAVALAAGKAIVGEENGTVTVHRFLPGPEAGPNQPAPALIAALRDHLASVSMRIAEKSAVEPLWNRLAKSDFTQKSWARWSELIGKPLAFEADHGTELAAALAGEDAEKIASLSECDGVPLLLRRVSQSRVALLKGRKADAIAGWSDSFPDLGEIRRREDWAGWEQADFGPALEGMKSALGEVLGMLEVPEDSTPDSRKELVARLTDPATRINVGRARLADACLRAALAFSAIKEEKEATFLLAQTARNLGAPAEPCLRAEALALTAMGDFQQAQPRWVTLITEHPVETHEPGDYAEAAYTSFENKDLDQAMAILDTGMHRYPADAKFALRAGWVALLIGNAEKGYAYLLNGQNIGFPAEKRENGTALLAIAAVRTGAIEDAAAYFEELVEMDVAWTDPKTIETLEWPEDLKSTLRQLVW